MTRPFDPRALVIRTAETEHPDRFVSAPGIVNLRDIGGYATADGRMVRFGQLFRSGALDAWEPAGGAALARLNLRTVYDLRSPQEQARRPSRLPAGAIYHHRPIAETGRLTRLRALLLFTVWRRGLSSAVQQSYRRVTLERHAPVLGELLTAAADPARRPLLVHCSAGKDRTGVAIALLLAVLGVPDDAIVADYALSNLFYDQFAARVWQDVPALERLRVTPADIQPALLAHPDTLRSALGWLRGRYGSVERYLVERAGVAADLPDRLRAALLTEHSQ